MNPTDHLNDVTPESLMGNFQGPKLSKAVVLTIVVHAVVILGTSIPFLIGPMLGGGEELTKEQRVEQAMVKVNDSLDKIAGQHDLTAMDLRNYIGKGMAPKAPSADEGEEGTKEKPTTDGGGEDPASTGTEEPDTPKSTIEQELEKTADGPDVPDLGAPIEEDLFN